MSQLLLSCDQVFNVLTRGPFPTGAPGDEAVERHLCACHDCRQLADALQPAVAMLHEAIRDGEAHDLPNYQGVLAQQRRPPLATTTRLGKSAATSAARQAPQSRARFDTRSSSSWGNVRWIALSLLVAVAVITARGITLAPRARLSLAGLFLAPSEVAYADGRPGERSLLTLASLNLPMACLPHTHRPTTAAEAAQIAEALANGALDAARCCTECHRAGHSSGARAAKLVAMSEVTCRACHRG